MLNLESQAPLYPLRSAGLYLIRMTIGARIRELRSTYGLSQEAFGAKAGNISKSAVSLWESDKSMPETSNLIELRKTLNFCLDWLLTGMGDAPEKMTPEQLELKMVAQEAATYAVARHNKRKKTVNGDS